MAGTRAGQDKKKREKEANFISLRALEWICQHSNLVKLTSLIRCPAQELCPSPHTQTLFSCDPRLNGVSGENN